MATASVTGFRWAGALLAFGCAVLFVGELRYLPLGPTLGLPSSPATCDDAMRIALGQETLYSSLILVWWTVAALAFGRTQFEHNLRYDAQATASPTAGLNPRARSRLEVFYRLPALLLPDPMAAIVEKELRALSRTPRFRMVFIMGFSFGLLVWLPITFGGPGHGSTIVSDHYLTIVSVYALTLLGQVSYLNTFGFDRSAAQIYFSVPVSIAQALAGKNIAAVLFILVEMLAVTLASLVLRIAIAPGELVEAFVVTAIVGVYLLAIGNMASVHFPRAMNPERVSQGGAASRMQALIFLLYPIALLPVFLAFWAQYVFGSQLIFVIIMCFAAILGAVSRYFLIMRGSFHRNRRADSYRNCFRTRLPPRVAGCGARFEDALTHAAYPGGMRAAWNPPHNPEAPDRQTPSRPASIQQSELRVSNPLASYDERSQSLRPVRRPSASAAGSAIGCARTVTYSIHSPASTPPRCSTSSRSWPASACSTRRW